MKRIALALALTLSTACAIRQPATAPGPAAAPDRTPTQTSESARAVPVPFEPITEEDFAYFDVHPMMVPVAGVDPRTLRDTFHERRDGGRIHRAQDILAPRDTPVLAAIAGEVARMSQNSLGGVTVYLTDTERRYVYYYAHLDHYADHLTVGLKVDEGTVIGYVGTSGNAPPDTPHLHFQAMRIKPGQRDWWNGTPVDVRQFMIRPGKAIE
ncbi:MAG TPA: M23 family metallopeptidase [Gemmatimonadaceae bacterium]|nr:M23 family metallopeptidase [Gemmatimonadaceae bacterium]